METTDLLGSLAGGDKLPEAIDSLKREQDSVDDFEHLEREGKRDESPFHHAAAERSATQGFLDTEREELFVDTPRAPSVADKLSDHLADKFTDSESEVSAGESPLHRPEPPKPSAPTTEPAAPVFDTTPILAPSPAPVAKPDPVPEVKPEPKLAPVPEAKPIVPEPVPAPVVKEPAPQPKPTPKEPEVIKAPTAHVIEAEVIFCQMGLGEWIFLTNSVV